MNGWLDTSGIETMAIFFTVGAIVGFVVFITAVIVAIVKLSGYVAMMGFIVSAILFMLIAFTGSAFTQVINSQPRIESVQAWADENYGSIVTESTAQQFIDATESSRLAKEPILFPLDGDNVLVKVVQGPDGGFLLYQVDGTLIPQNNSR